MAEKNLYIRCDEETYVKARELAQKNLRSLNRQVIHLINEAYDSVVKSEPQIAEPQPIQAEPQPIQDEEDDKYIDGVLKTDIYKYRDDVPREILEEWESQGKLTQSGLEKLSEIRKLDSSD